MSPQIVSKVSIDSKKCLKVSKKQPKRSLRNNFDPQIKNKPRAKSTSKSRSKSFKKQQKINNPISYDTFDSQIQSLNLSLEQQNNSSNNNSTEKYIF